MSVNTTVASIDWTNLSDFNATTTSTFKPRPTWPAGTQPLGYYGDMKVTLWQVVPPIIMIWGTVGNILTILVLLRQKRALSSTGMFLMTLAVSDTVILYTGPLPQWLKQTWNYDLRFLTDAGCKTSLYFSYASLHFSSWLLVAVTMERTVSVVLPHKVRLGCTPRNASLVILAMFVVIWGINIVNPVIQGLDNFTGMKCEPTTEAYLKFQNEVWSWIDFCIVFAIPFVFLLVGNVTIIVYLRKSRLNQQTMTASRGKNASTSGRDMKSVSVLMILLCVIFFLTMTPAAVFGIYQPYRLEQILELFKTDMYAAWYANQYLLFQHAVVNLVSYTNASFNFILYVFSGKKFRAELVAMFQCRKPDHSGVFGSKAMADRTISNGKTTTTLIEIKQTGIKTGIASREYAERSFTNDEVLENATKVGQDTDKVYPAAAHNTEHACNLQDDKDTETIDIGGNKQPYVALQMN